MGKILKTGDTMWTDQNATSAARGGNFSYLERKLTFFWFQKTNTMNRVRLMGEGERLRKPCKEEDRKKDFLNFATPTAAGLSTGDRKSSSNIS